MMPGANERVAELSLGFHPEAAVSGGLLLQSESRVYLLFNAMRESDQGGHMVDAGVGVLTFPGCITTRFGYPNDEGLPEHPLRAAGLQAYEIAEVMDSTWAAEWHARTEASTRRIWGARQEYAHRTERVARHFIITFHDSTFECVAADITARLADRPWDNVVAEILAELMKY